MAVRMAAYEKIQVHPIAPTIERKRYEITGTHEQVAAIAYLIDPNLPHPQEREATATGLTSPQAGEAFRAIFHTPTPT